MPAGARLEFVGIARPMERAESADGGPIHYRVRHRTPLWRPGEAPTLALEVREGDARFCV